MKHASVIFVLFFITMKFIVQFYLLLFPCSAVELIAFLFGPWLLPFVLEGDCENIVFSLYGSLLLMMHGIP